MPSLKICFHGVIQASMFMSEIEFIPMTKPALVGNLARYIIRACFSQERMVYIPAEAFDDNTAKIVYTSKDRNLCSTVVGSFF